MRSSHYASSTYTGKITFRQLILIHNIYFLYYFYRIKNLYFIFFVAKLKGMNEHVAKVTTTNINLEIPKAVFEIANVTRVISEKENTFR